MSRWIRFFIVFAIGLAAGLFYAWWINPVKHIDASPNTLRQDYKTDYVLMVAEVYYADGRLDASIQHLGLLSSEPPAQTVDEALAYARGSANNNQPIYPLEDLALMQALADALKTMQPTPENP